MSNATEQEMGTALSVISRADELQLRRIIESVQARRASLNRAMIHTLKVGAKVKWNGKHGAKTGVVQKIKQKYVEVKEDVPSGTHVFGMVWNVPANMLTVIP